MYPLKFTGIFKGCLYKGVPSKTLRQRKTQCFQGFFAPCTSYEFAAEQKARSTYDNLLRLTREHPEVYEPLKFLREREIVHFQRFGEALRIVQDELDSNNFYAFNPAFDNPAASIQAMRNSCRK